MTTLQQLVERLELVIRNNEDVFFTTDEAKQLLAAVGGSARVLEVDCGDSSCECCRTAHGLAEGQPDVDDEDPPERELDS
jgi:Na+-transporting NADH:ubiquinone oxidoreductase subunit NqrF